MVISEYRVINYSKVLRWDLDTNLCEEYIYIVCRINPKAHHHSLLIR